MLVVWRVMFHVSNIVVVQSSLNIPVQTIRCALNSDGLALEFADENMCLVLSGMGVINGLLYNLITPISGLINGYPEAMTLISGAKTPCITTRGASCMRFPMIFLQHISQEFFKTDMVPFWVMWL